MENVFLEFFNLSIKASWIVFAVLITRVILKKTPRWINCILWSVVGFRLVFPFSPESIFGILPSKNLISEETLYQSAPTIDSGIESINNAVNPIFSEVFAANHASSVNPLQLVTIICSYLWILGIILMISYTFISYLILKRKTRSATLLKDNVFQSEYVPSPFVLGIIKPKIYLPYIINEEDIPYVIAHENAHIKRKDHLIKPIAFLILTLYWFNPLLWLSYVLLCKDIELACDEKVVKNFDKERCKAYSYALLNCSINRKSIAACPLAFGEAGVKDRIKNVLSYKKPALWIILTGITVCVITAVCFLTSPRGVTLKNGYGYEPLTEKTDRIEITTPDNTYIFTSEDRIRYLSEKINAIAVDKDKTVEIEKMTTSYFPYPAYVIKGYVGDNQYFERCISSDFRNLWTSEEIQCQYLFYTQNPENVKSVMTSELKSSVLKEQADKLISELILELYGYSPDNSALYCTESHYTFKESVSEESETESMSISVIYNCSAFSYDTFTLKNEQSIKGVSEFTFKIYGDKVVYESVTEHVRGGGSSLESFGSTEDIDLKLEEEVRKKAENHFGIGITVDTAKGDISEEETAYAVNDIEFSYAVCPVYPIDHQTRSIEDIIKEKSLNSSHLIRNQNKQIYGCEYCLIYKENSSENLITDYIEYADINKKSEGLISISEAADKYSAVEDETDLYIVYIPDSDGTSKYTVNDFDYSKGFMTAMLTAQTDTAYTDKNYTGYLAMIYVPKNISLSYDSFTAFISEEPSVWEGGGEINLSDIEEMNISAEMPTMLYCENGVLIMSGTFGLILYDFYNKRIVERIDYRLLNSLGIEYLEANVSADGERIYLGNADLNYGSSTPLYTYYVQTNTLYYYGGELENDTLYGGLRKWDYNGSTDIPEQGYIYSYHRKHDDYGGCYLRAKADWSMKSLQVVIYKNSGETQTIDIFGNKASLTVS